MSETINKFLHESLRLCWHKWPLNDADIPTLPCAVCGDIGVMWPQPNPDYCSSLDAVAVVEKFVIEKFGAKKYAETLMDLMEQLHGKPSDKTDEEVFAIFLTVPAQRRAEACYAVLKKEQQNER